MVTVMVMNDLLPHPLCNVNRPYHSEIQLFQWSRSRSCVWSKVKVTFDLQHSNVRVIVKVKSIGHIWGLEFNRYVCFSFRGNRTTFGWYIANLIFNLENSKSKVMAKVKPDGHIWGLGFNRYVCFLFHGNRTVFGWDIANSIFELENSRSRSRPRSNMMVTFKP